MGNTPNLALPYPANTDPVANMAAAVQSLATAADLAMAGNYAILKFVGAFTMANGTSQLAVSTVVKSRGITTAGTGTLTITTAGLYVLVGRVGFTTTTGTGEASITVQLGPSRTDVPVKTTAKFAGSWLVLNAVGMAFLNVGDTVKLMATQTSGVGISVPNSDDVAPYLFAARVGV